MFEGVLCEDRLCHVAVGRPEGTCILGLLDRHCNQMLSEPAPVGWRHKDGSAFSEAATLALSSRAVSFAATNAGATDAHTSYPATANAATDATQV